MHAETMTYTDFNGVERTETYLFNLTKAELLEMELMRKGGFTDLLERIIKAKDTPELMKEVKTLILYSYGVKSEDGRYFRKNDQIRADFENSEPYSELLLKLLSDDEAAAKFVQEVMPKEVVEAAADDPEVQEKIKQLTGSNPIVPVIAPPV